MSDDPRESAQSSQQFGATMRIDIATERREAEREKLKSDPRRKSQPVIRVPKVKDVSPTGGNDFQQLLQNIYDAAFVTELNGDIVLANLRANHYFHAQPGQFQGSNIKSFLCGVDEHLFPMILKTLEENRFVLIQAFCTRLDDTYFAAEISVNQLDLGGRHRLSFFIRDVTLRKEQEERLRTGYAALQNASSGIAITGPNAEIEYCNGAFLALFELPERRADENLRELFSESEKVDEIVDAILRGDTWAGELEMRRVGGSIFFGQTSVSANLNAEGETVGMVLSVLDVTPQKMAQQQLERYAHELHQKNTQMQQDLNVAGELHEAFLPEESIHFPHGTEPDAAAVLFQHRYCPSGTIGGDFFDIRQLSKHEIGIFISDVMGHGIRSALVVATIRGLIEELRPLALDPGAFMTQLNQTYTAIFQQMDGDVTFSTAFYGVLDTRSGAFHYVNASHPTPFVLRRKGERLQRLRTSGEKRSQAFGLFGDAQFTTFDYPLEPGNVLLLYTDGLSEVENPEGELYDENRLDEVLIGKMDEPVGKLLDDLIADARDFADETAFEDDVCLVALEFLKRGE